MALFLIYARRGKIAWWRYPVAIGLAGVFILVGIVVADLTVGGLYHALGDRPPPDIWGKSARPDQAAFHLTNFLPFGIFLLGFSLAVYAIHGKKPADLLGRWSWLDFGLGFGLWLGLSVISVLIHRALAPQDLIVIASSATISMILPAVAGVAIQTFWEEYLDRGYLTQALLLATKRPVVASLISALLFSLGHIPYGIGSVISAGLLGVLLSLVTIRTGGIALAWGIHLGHNLFLTLIAISPNGRLKESPGLVLLSESPSLWWWATITAVVKFSLLLVLVYGLKRWPKSSEFGPKI